MPERLGSSRVTLHEDDLHVLMRRFPALDALQFRAGCWSYVIKLPMGFAVSLLAVPTSHPGCVKLLIPFDRIRGQRSGFLAGQAAQLGWGWICERIQQEAAARLVQAGFSAGTVRVDQDYDPQGNKVGRIAISIDELNRGLALRPFLGGLRCTIEAIFFEADRILLQLAWWGCDSSLS